MNYKAKIPNRKDAKLILNNSHEYISNVDFLVAVIYMLDNELNNKEKLLREKSSIITNLRTEISNLEKTIDRLKITHLSDKEKEDFISRIIDAIYEE